MAEHNEPIEDPRVASLDLDGDLMAKCFERAKTYLMGYPHDQRLRTDIALALFNRCTREVSEEEVEEDPDPYLGSFPFKKIPVTVFVDPPTCDHPGLRVLYHQWLGCLKGSITLIEALTVSEVGEDGADCLLCPHCRLFVPVDEFKAGELQSLTVEVTKEQREEMSPWETAACEISREDIEECADDKGVGEE